MALLDRLIDLIMPPKVEEQTFKDQRSSPRISCFIEALLTLDAKSMMEGTIIALESSGMRLILPSKLAKGQTFSARLSKLADITLERPFSIEEVLCEVVWCRQKKGFPLYYAGIKFVESAERIQKSFVNSILEHYGITGNVASQKRREIRIITALPVKIYYGDKNFLTGLAHDIGPGGLKINLIRNPGLGCDVKLHIGPYRNLSLLECHGRIKRSSYSARREDYNLGIEFVDMKDEQSHELSRYLMLLLKEACL